MTILFVVLVTLLVTFLLAYYTARLAESRGRSFWVYAIFCFIVPIAALIAVPYLLVFTRRVRRGPKPPVLAETASAESPLGDLERIARLMEQGVLTPDEAEREKRRLLGWSAPGFSDT